MSVFWDSAQNCRPVKSCTVPVRKLCGGEATVIKV